MQASKKDTKDGLYSQSAIAKTLGLSEATISRAIDDLKLNPAKIDGKSKLYTSAQVEQIKEARKQGTTAKNKAQGEIDRLMEQLRAKDEQISQLNDQLRMAQINLNQAQQLQLEQAQEIKRLQLPEAPQDATGAAESPSNQSNGEKMVNRVKSAKVTTSDKPMSEESKAAKSSWWSRLFGRN